MKTAEVVAVNEGLSQSLTDISECNREKIHLIASVQNRGCLLIFSWPDERVQSSSQNTREYIGVSHEETLGSKMSHLFEPDFVSLLKKAIEEGRGETSVSTYFQHFKEDFVYDCHLFATEGLFGLEIEKSPVEMFDTEPVVRSVTEQLRDFNAEIKSALDTFELADMVCKRVRSITGIDRVMLYKFLHPTWHGEVIGEDRVIHAHSYMGHRFPSSDIPQPARELYLRNKTRVISDVSGDDSEVYPNRNPLTDKPLDLSDSRLRSSSRIHLEYLRNMGVQASISFAITVRGQLWGLIACHHLEPYFLSQSKRSACEAIAESTAALAPMLDLLQTYRARMSFDSRLKKLVSETRGSTDFVSALLKDSLQLVEIFDSRGVAFSCGTKIDLAGITPRSAGVKELVEKLENEMNKTSRSSVAIMNLHEKFRDLQNVDKSVAGVLAVRVPDVSDCYLFFFRPEMIKTIVWGGDPVKQLDKKSFQGQINPRKSFSAWEEVIRSQAKDWQPYEIDGARDLVELIHFSRSRK